VEIEKGKSSENGVLRAIVQIFEKPGTRVDIDDARLFPLTD
jgi:hypothetical protein